MRLGIETDPVQGLQNPMTHVVGTTRAAEGVTIVAPKDTIIVGEIGPTRLTMTPWTVIETESRPEGDHLIRKRDVIGGILGNAAEMTMIITAEVGTTRKCKKKRRRKRRKQSYPNRHSHLTLRRRKRKSEVKAGQWAWQSDLIEMLDN